MTNLKKDNQVNNHAKNILIVGSGGRENALAWGLSHSDGVEKIFIAPGNGGSRDFDKCVSIDIATSDVDKIKNECKLNKIDLVVIGPEAPLASGLADKLREDNIAVFGPGKDGAQLEASKSWAKDLMNKVRIPTAQHWEIKNLNEALSIINECKKPLVVKVDGLALPSPNRRFSMSTASDITLDLRRSDG